METNSFLGFVMDTNSFQIQDLLIDSSKNITMVTKTLHLLAAGAMQQAALMTGKGPHTGKLILIVKSEAAIKTSHWTTGLHNLQALKKSLVKNFQKYSFFNPQRNFLLYLPLSGILPAMGTSKKFIILPICHLNMGVNFTGPSKQMHFLE